MGYYINPTNMSKEAWLKANATMITESAAKEHKAGDKLVVCLVDNDIFTAAGIAYNDKERDHFARPDGRPKLWFLVDKDKLTPFM